MKLDRDIDKLDDKLARLWPEGNDDGNGNGHSKKWKGKPIISVEEWKRLAGYIEPADILTKEIDYFFKVDYNNDSKGLEMWTKLISDSRLRREISPEALQYFPQDIITVVFNPSYSCPKAPDLFMVWVSDYRELLTSKGFRKLNMTAHTHKK